MGTQEQPPPAEQGPQNVPGSPEQGTPEHAAAMARLGTDYEGALTSEQPEQVEGAPPPETTPPPAQAPADGQEG
jgi:hypothetical protein